MLNRRYLRMKAMQVLYALEQAKNVDYQIILDEIDQLLVPEWNEDAKKADKLAEEQSLAKMMFEMSFDNQFVKNTEEIPGHIRKIVVNSLNKYKNTIKNEVNHFEKYLHAEVAKIYDLYLLVLLFGQALAEFVEQERTRKSQNYIDNIVVESDYNLTGNQLIEAFKKHVELQNEATRRNLHWNQEDHLIKDFYRTSIKNDELFQTYSKTSTHSFEEDLAIISHILKNLLLKEEVTQPFFEDYDLNWDENSKIIRSMVSNTLKEITEENKETFDLASLSKNWEDDNEFLKELFQKTILLDEKCEKIISSKSKNWDMSRLAMIDKIILKMAITEMLNFSSIPVKVTINEFIELSKIYSTPKSKQFINGLLDNISNELINNGEIKKSARGLMDNK